MSLDIVLVNPSIQKEMFGKLGESLAGIEPPLWIGLLAAVLRDRGFSVKIIDAEAEGLGAKETVDKIIEYSPLTIGIGAVGANPSASSTPKMVGVRHVVSLLKEKNIASATILYGIHPSALPEQTLKEERADFVCRGEAFEPISKLLEELKSQKKELNLDIKGLCYLKNGNFVDNGWADVVEDLDSLPFVAWDLLPMEKYRAHNWHCFGDVKHRSPYAIIYSSLGCPFHCHYCNIHALYSGNPGIRFRSPKRVVEEIDYLVEKYQVRHMKILDELFVIDKQRMFEICDLLIERNHNINFWAYARVDTVSEEVLKKLKAAGINWLCYGIEAGSADVRQGVSKGRFSQDVVKKAMKMTQDAGIHIIGNFMFGLPDDTLETMQETFSLAQEINCEYVNFYATMAYPGSPLYQDAIKQGLSLPDGWMGFSQFSPQTLPLPTKYCSAEEVLRFRDDAFNAYYSNSKYLDMILEKFGQETVDHIKEMLKHKLKRDILSK
ncbi:MAG: radical SAM protein [Candidatus Omnitrophica bacterium]|nr:radical SAM protein [Candidatus Omnitrophota bacterium]